jgi:uncharacterized protein
MNALTCSHDIDPHAAGHRRCLRCQLREGRSRLQNDDQIRRIQQARQWRRTGCAPAPAPLQMPGAGPYIAIHTQLITRKSLGGLRTDLHSRVLDAPAAPIPACIASARPPASAAAVPAASVRWRAPSCPAAS